MMSLKLFTVSLLLWTTTAFANLDGDVLIQGRIHSFDSETARVIDEHDQIFDLPRAIFPKSFVFQTDKAFTLEIRFADFEKLKIQKFDRRKR